MPPVTRSEAKDPLSGLMRKMSLMTKIKTPRTKKPATTVAPDDMLVNMLSGLTLGKSMKSKSRRKRGTGFSRRKTHKSKTHKMVTTGGRRRRGRKNMRRY